MDIPVMAAIFFAIAIWLHGFITGGLYEIGSSSRSDSRREKP